MVAPDPARPDSVVAVISHVPHLTAATLMGLASDRAEEHAALAAGFVRVHLGPRILRAETAPLAVLAWLGLRG